ncbi:MAG TPA: hypothetical protein VGH97_09755 [Thermoanaerobaculia bacterium]
MRKILMLGLPFALAALALLVAPAKLSADDLTGAQSLLCTAVSATLCTDDGECQTESPWELNVPQFLEFDLKGKMMSTTKASGENRSTPMKTLEKDNGLIFIQGIELGRAFSLVIAEKTGDLSVAVARDGKAVSVFGACTPTSAAK